MSKQIEIPVVSYNLVVLTVPDDFDPTKLFEDENERYQDQLWEKTQNLSADWEIDDEEFDKLYPSKTSS